MTQARIAENWRISPLFVEPTKMLVFNRLKCVAGKGDRNAQGYTGMRRIAVSCG